MPGYDHIVSKEYAMVSKGSNFITLGTFSFFFFFLLVGNKFFCLSYGVYGVTQLKWIVAICRDLLGLGFATYPTVYDMPGIKNRSCKWRFSTGNRVKTQEIPILVQFFFISFLNTCYSGFAK
jgi:hypothetical protein